MRKIKRSILVFFMTAESILAQSTNSCCSRPSLEQFALLSSDKAFKASHLAPLPFSYDSPKGKMINLLCEDKKEAVAFEIKSNKPSNNYLLVIHEWWGLNEYIKQAAEKLQNELMDVNVIALDLYDGKVADNPDTAAKYMGEAKEERIKSIINAVINYTGKGAKIQTIGWCFGGGWSVQASLLAGKQAVGCVLYYGMPEKDIRKIKSISFPVLGLFAAQDGWITKDIVNEFEKRMKENKKEITIKMFDAPHGFANPSNPKYDKKSAEEANKAALAFLKKNLN